MITIVKGELDDDGMVDEHDDEPDSIRKVSGSVPPA